MHCASRLALIAVAVVALAACEQARPSLTGPSGPPSAAGTLEAGDDRLAALLAGHLGAHGDGVLNSAAQESGFTCGLAGFGIATQSHATISNSGNQTLHCSGDTTLFTPERAVIIEGTPCRMHYENVLTTDSRIVITPSGHVSVTCKSKQS